MVAYRGFVVWGASTSVVMSLFLSFVFLGWPGDADSCTENKPNTCFCEAFNATEVKEGAPGVRQKVNTWSNLYAVGTSLLVAFMVWGDRKNAGPRTKNLMQSTSWVPDLYIFAVLFLGLGSMWFHASIKSWGSTMDGFSMYVYAAFLFFYSMRRKFVKNCWFFWVGYLSTVAVFTTLHHLLKDDFEYASLILIMILVVAYLVVEVAIWIVNKQVLQGQPRTIAMWLSALAAIGFPTAFWALSQTGERLCDPEAFFQPHGLFWHPLAGVMALMLYFYWREADDDNIGLDSRNTHHQHSYG